MRSACRERMGWVSESVLAQDLFHNGVLLCNEGIFSIEISNETALTLSFDTTLKLCPGLRTYIGHALVIFALDSHFLLRRSRSGKSRILGCLQVVDEGEVKFGFDVILECIDPRFWAMARYSGGSGLRRWCLRVARGNRLRNNWGGLNGWGERAGNGWNTFIDWRCLALLDQPWCVSEHCCDEMVREKVEGEIKRWLSPQ